MRIPPQPVIHEVNTWVWLADLSEALGRRVTLGDVPAVAWDDLAGTSHADAVWLMGVWTRSRASAAVTAADPAKVAGFRRTLADYAPEDNIGSAYAVAAYEVDPHLGGRAGLAAARRALAARGLGLLLDFVPNHVAPDHPWATEHPEHFIEGTAEELDACPPSHLRVAGRILACGRDPNFPAWPDTLQLALNRPALRAALRDTLLEVADQCDGVRCDMAMLALDRVVARTWGTRAGEARPVPFWRELIPAVRQQHPGFLLIAEVYWDLESELLEQGFDLCYDKVVLDMLEARDAAGLEEHLCAPLAHQRGLVRFVENHDEPRAALVLPGPAGPTAALVVLTLPGAVLLHEGQLEGRTRFVEVFLRRRPREAPDAQVRASYAELLDVVLGSGMRRGTWRPLPRGGPILAWRWDTEDAGHLVAVNITDAAAVAHLPTGARLLLGSAAPGDAVHRPAATDVGGPAGEQDVTLGPWDHGVWRVAPLP